MRTFATWTLAALIGVVPMVAAPKVKPPTAAQLQAQVKKLTQERDDLKDRLAALDGLQQDLAAAEKSRDLSRQEADGLRKELTDIKSNLSENQSGADAILADFQKTKADLVACQAQNADLKKQMEEAKTKVEPEVLVSYGQPEIIAARPLNLSRATPKIKDAGKGAVIVNVLVNENGEVIDTRMIQALPGNDIGVQKGNQSLLEAAKRIVFDPARTADGKTKLRVWQPVAFMIN